MVQKLGLKTKIREGCDCSRLLEELTNEEL